MTESIRKEEISMSYLAALCADAGIDFERMRHDSDSSDVIIKKEIKIGEAPFLSSVRFQLKATSSVSQYSETEQAIQYKLKVKNYNDLCKQGTIPSYLALLILPDDEKEWVKWSEQDLLMKARMYALDFNGLSESDNEYTVGVELDKNNQINKKLLMTILENAVEGGR